jgi:C4-dicarboxylate transporter DctM subunit
MFINSLCISHRDRYVHTLRAIVIKGIAKAPMAEVVRGIVPYVGLMLLGLALMLLFPGLSTWLPATMGYGR